MVIIGGFTDLRTAPILKHAHAVVTNLQFNDIISDEFFNENKKLFPINQRKNFQGQFFFLATSPKIFGWMNFSMMEVVISSTNDLAEA